MAIDEDFEIDYGELVQYKGNKESVIIPDNVTNICDNAFEDCTSLSSITIPDSVTSIEYNAFKGCTNLNSITMSSNVMIRKILFNGCSNLSSIIVYENNPIYTSIDGIVYDKEVKKLILVPEGIKDHIKIPSSVTSIRAYAFEGCAGFSSVNIPDGVTYIGRFAFKDCTSLKSITIPSCVESIGDGAFEGCKCLKEIILKNKELSIKKEWFGSDINIMKNLADATDELTSDNSSDSYKEKNWTFKKNEDDTLAVTNYEGTDLDIIIPDSIGTKSVTTIGKYAFENCTDLKSITIPDSIITIEEGAFYGCESLSSITIPDSVTTIGDEAFSECTSLNSINIGKSVTSIERSFFGECEDQSININVSKNNPKFASIYGVVFDKEIKELILALNITEDLYIPKGVTTIRDGAVFAVSSFIIEIPDSVTIIDEDAFEECYDLVLTTPLRFVNYFREHDCKVIDTDD